jgi:Flp pilus assembly protein TadB
MGRMESSVDERRRGLDRRATDGRRLEDRRQRFRDATAMLLAFCGGLVVLFLFFVAIGTVDPGDAVVATIGAVVLTLVWLAGAYQRYRSGAIFVTRRDRERRGY